MSHSTHLRLLEASGLVSLANVLPEVEYLFRHTLIQEAAYGSLLKSDRQSLHLITGSVLEDLYKEHESDIAPILAGHFRAAGEDERALKYYTISGDKAMAVYAIPEAIEHYKLAIAIAKANPSWYSKLERLFTQLGYCFELNAQYDQALANFREMESFAVEIKDDSMKLAAMIARAKAYATPSAVHDAGRVQQLCNEALELARGTNNKAAQARIHWILSLSYARNGKYHEAILHGEDAHALAIELNLTELAAFTLNDLTYPYLSTFQFEKGYQAIIESQAMWRNMGNLVMLVDNLSTMITYDYFSARYDHGLQTFEEAVALSESIGNRWGQAYCRMYTGSIYFDRGHPGEGIQIMRECLDLAKQAGFTIPLLVTQADLGFAMAYLGNHERGIEIIDSALKENIQAITGWYAWTYAMKARVHILRNEFDQTRASLGAAQSAHGQGAPLFMGLLIRGIECELALAIGDYAYALETTLFFEDEIITDVHQFAPWLYYLRGVALYRNGRHQEASTTLANALAEAEAVGMRRILWQIQAAMAEVADLQGESGQARQLRVQAKATISYIAERVGNQGLRVSFLSRPDVAALMGGA